MNEWSWVVSPRSGNHWTIRRRLTHLAVAGLPAERSRASGLSATRDALRGPRTSNLGPTGRSRSPSIRRTSRRRNRSSTTPVRGGSIGRRRQIRGRPGQEETRTGPSGTAPIFNLWVVGHVEQPGYSPFRAVRNLGWCVPKIEHCYHIHSSKHLAASFHA